MTPALNGSSALQRFERSNEIKLRNVRFLPGNATNLLHVYYYQKKVCIKNPSTVNMVEIDLSPPKIT